MNELDLLNNLIESVVKLTQQSLADAQNSNFDRIDSYIEERGKAIDIITFLLEKLNINPTYNNSVTITQYNNQLNQLVELIKKSDHDLVKFLEEESTKTQNQIAKTYKNKENLKGYNLNILK